jgi:hypothetical protein
MKYEEKLKLVPVTQKCLLTLDEAIAFTGLGRDTLIEWADNDDLNLVVWTGRKRLYKRRRLEEYIDKVYSV